MFVLKQGPPANVYDGAVMESASSGTPISAAVERLKSLCQGFCKVSKTLANNEVQDCARLGEALKTHLRNKSEQLLAASRHQPVLYSYSSDATAILCQHVAEARQGTHTVVRKGRVLHELLMQRGFLRATSPSGDDQVALLIRDPLPLSVGKKSWNLFAAGAGFFPLLRHCGHEGICISHFVADRLAFSSLDRMFRQRQKAYYTPGMGPPLGEEAPLKEMTDWHVGCACAAHDAHNALKWSLSSFSGPEVVKDMHVVLEALRNSFAILHAHLPRFLATHLAFRDAIDNSSATEDFWRTMGVDVENLDRVTEVAPWWDGSHLTVCATLKDDPDCLEKVSAVFLYFCRWRAFTETRWATIGPACRALVCCLCVGLEKLVSITRADTTVTDYNLHGFSRLSPSLKKFAVIAALASVVPDALLVELLADDRVVKRSETLRETVMEEMHWIESIGDSVWARLGFVVGAHSSPSELRHCVVHSASVAFAFVHKRIFQELESLPWRLAVGDIDQNLADLEESQEPISDMCAHRVRQLLRAGYNRATLKEAVSLLREVPWTSVPVEQAHGSCAVIHRQHPMYSLDTLAHRALVHQCRHLFVKDPEERKLDKQQAVVDALKKKQPGRVSGRHAFMGALAQSVKATLPAGSKMPANATHELMRQHTTLYKNLDPQAMAVWDKVAELRSEVKAQAAQEEVTYRTATLDLQRSRYEVSLAEGMWTRTSLARFSDSDWAEMVVLMDSPSFARSEVTKLRAKALAPPEVPPQAVVEQLESCPVHASPPEVRMMPWWLKRLCQQRDELIGCILLTSLEEGALGYYFLHATKSPFHAMFLPVRMNCPPLPPLLGTSEEGTLAEWDSWTKWGFDFDPGVFVSDHRLGFPAEQKILVIQDVFFQPGCRLVGGREAENLEKVLEQAPAAPVPEPAQPNRSAKARKSAEQEALAQYPWLAEYLGKSGPSSSKRAKTSPDERGPAHEPPELDDAAMALVWEKIEAFRQQWGIDGTNHGADFVTAVKGGAWTQRHLGIAVERVTADARKGAPSLFCQTYGFNQGMSFTLKRYGDLNCSALALEWCRRMQFWFDLWLEQGDTKYRFSAEELLSYEEAPGWRAFCDNAPSVGVLADRINAIRGLFPQSPS